MYYNRHAMIHERICENCSYWQQSEASPVYVSGVEGKVRVGQCCNHEDEEAPNMLLDLPESFIFTSAEGRCDAFVMDEEIAVYMEETQQVYRDFDDQQLCHTYGKTKRNYFDE